MSNVHLNDVFYVHYIADFKIQCNSDKYFFPVSDIQNKKYKYLIFINSRLNAEYTRVESIKRRI